MRVSNFTVIYDANVLYPNESEKAFWVERLKLSEAQLKQSVRSDSS